MGLLENGKLCTYKGRYDRTVPNFLKLEWSSLSGVVGTAIKSLSIAEGGARSSSRDNFFFLNCGPRPGVKVEIAVAVMDQEDLRDADLFLDANVCHGGIGGVDLQPKMVARPRRLWRPWRELFWPGGEPLVTTVVIISPT